jgi:hypothetical protein
MDNPEFILGLRKNLHDLNNKLTVISAYGSSLRYRNDIPEDVVKYVEIMVRVAMESGGIVQEVQKALRDFSQEK